MAFKIFCDECKRPIRDAFETDYKKLREGKTLCPACGNLLLSLCEITYQAEKQQQGILKEAQTKLSVLLNETQVQIETTKRAIIEEKPKEEVSDGTAK